MKRIVPLFLSVAVIFAAALSACGKSADTAVSNTGSSSGSAEKITINWLQFQIENATQVKALAKAYSAENPNVTINVDVMGDGYFDVLKSRAASGDMPDIFMTKGYSYLTTYKDYMEDLSAQPFVSKLVEASKPCITLDGKIMGLPVQMGGWGIVYNKKIFSDNNLKIPTTFSELENICKTLKSKGITPFVDQYKDAWMLGHLTGAGYGRVSNSTAFIGKLNAGTAKLAGIQEMKDNLKFLNLTLQYSQDTPLSTDQNAACTLMAQGKAAMYPEGDWVYSTITQVNKDIQLGMFAVPTTDNAADTKLSSDVNGVWHIYSKSPNKTEAEKILNWIVDSSTGKNFVTKDCKFIPAYKNLKSELSPVGNDIQNYIAESKTSIWGWLDAPDGYENNSGSVIQQYINKQLTEQQTLEKLDGVWAKSIAKQ